MKEKVAKISVEATVAGYDLAVQEATISLGVNAIPAVELMCAPSEANYSYDSPTVVKPTISQFAKMYREMSVLAEGLSETGQVDIQVTGDDKDSCQLNNWILSGVGLSNASATSAPYLSVILQHPICKLTKAGSIYETPKGNINEKMRPELKGSNLIEIIDSAYKYMSGASDMFWPSPAGYDMAPKFRQALAEYKPSDYLVWKGSNGIFLSGGKDSGLKGRMTLAIGESVFPDDSGSSTWDMLLRSSGSLLVSITQDDGNNYTKDKLVLEPTQPWKTASITIDEARCAWVELPGMDPFRLVGVMARKLGPYADLPNQGFMPNGNPLEEKPTSEVMYAPVKNVEVADGRIVKTHAPAMLEAAFRMDAPYGNSVSQGTIELSKQMKDDYNSAIGKYCKAVYEITAASMIQAKAQMAVSFHSGGKLLLPGNTCRFKTKGQDLFYGYIRNVVHHVSTNGGNSTTVAMSYVRPEASFKMKGQEAIKAGAPNAAYE